MRPYIALVCGFALGFASSKTTNSCNIWAHNALLCIQYPIQICPIGKQICTQICPISIQICTQICPISMQFVHYSSVQIVYILYKFVPGSTLSFVGQDYFCDRSRSGGQVGVFYADNPLWDSQGCGGTSTCCEFNSPPWFCKQLPQPTTCIVKIELSCDVIIQREEQVALYMTYSQNF